ncbi:MAG: nucleotide exchange factor GrpE [Gammaproteobacteria bacterium]|jgi:molecular chaperone GrpE
MSENQEQIDNEETENAVSAGADKPGDNGGEPVTDESINNLQKQLEEALGKAEQNLEMALRAKAELENATRRHEQDLEKAHKYALDSFVKELLQVWDSLELGIQAGQSEGADIDKLLEGSELTLKLLSDVMNKFGVEQIDPDGEPFNPEEHQAMSLQPRDDVAPNTVVTVVQKGYKLNGRLVRPAMVMVSQAG